MPEVTLRLHGDRPGLKLRGELSTSAPVVALIGPSGAGKTTVLRAIAGLEPALRTDLTVEGEVWSSEQVFRAPMQRTTTWMPQQSLLFPHLDVRRNLGFGCSDLSKIAALAEDLALTPLLARDPRLLSGGEQQRVALGRALLSGRPWLLLDEPFSAQDAARRKQCLEVLTRWRSAPGHRIWIVTHREEELGDLQPETWRMVDGTISI